MVNPIRIRTRVGENGHVLTLYWNGKWITLPSLAGKSQGSLDTTSLQEAGENHLQAAHALLAKVSGTT